MRVLLVDPEADLLPALQAALLTAPGLELYCAPDGNAALEHAKLLGGVDALITEVFARDTDGIALRDRLRAGYPKLRTIFLSRLDLGAHADAVKDTPVLRIPLDAARVLTTLQAKTPLSVQAPPAAPIQATAVPVTKPSGPAGVAIAAAVPVATAVTAPTNASPKTAPPSSARETISRGEAPMGLAAKSETPRPPPAVPTASASLRPAAPIPPAATPSRITPVLPNEDWESAAQSADTAEPPKPLFEGASLGPYRIIRAERPSHWGPFFAAEHTSLGRPVHLSVLEPYRAALAELRADFLSDAGTKANVQHPAMLAVYEAGELDGHIFYAAERIDAKNLFQLANEGVKLEPFALLRVAITTAEVMQHLEMDGIPHLPLNGNDVLLQKDGAPRLQNIAIGGIQLANREETDISTLGNALLPLLPADAPLKLRYILERCAPTHKKRLMLWSVFLAECLECQAALERFNANSGANPVLPEAPRRVVWPWLLLLPLLVVGAGYLWLQKPNPLVPVQASVPGGQYLVGTGRRVSLQSFTIDSTEVTNRQYAKFLEWLRSHPTEAARFDHAEQPARLSHVPPGWKEMFPDTVKPSASAQDPRWDLPVTQVCWWDAYAFAHWAGRELPVEEHWEAAGRGPRGLLFPWGDEPDEERAQVKRLYKSGEQGGPVAASALRDASGFGVLGLTGNVSEWTDTRRDDKSAVAKGGHYNAPLLTLDAASNLPLDTRSPMLGFRTVSRNSPSLRP